ncbi:MAG TPA: hypothetical protein VF625_05410 [Longimicrobium sp.]
MQIMPYRYQALTRVVRGHELTGIPLVGSDGRVFTAEPYGDAGVGLYYLVPWIARTFHLSVDAALRIYEVAAVSGACALGLVGAFLLFRGMYARVVATIGIAVIGALCLRFGEGYLAGAVTVVAALPIFLYLYRDGRARWLLVALFLAGMLVGVADEIRSLIGAPVLVFILLTLALDGARSARTRALCACALLLGTAVPRVYASHLAHQRDAFLETVPNRGVEAARGHTMWHPLYLGLGYLPNRHGITYTDESAIAKVKSVDPAAAYLSPRYTSILRGEVIRIARDDPWLIARTLAAKAARILLYLAAFANVGLLLAFTRRPSWKTELPFAAAVALAVVPGMVGLPVLHYIVGGLAFAVVYSAASVEAAFALPALRLGMGGATAARAR